MAIQERPQQTVGRRQLLRGMVTSGLGLAGAALFGCATPQENTPPSKATEIPKKEISPLEQRARNEVLAFWLNSMHDPRYLDNLYKSEYQRNLIAATANANVKIDNIETLAKEIPKIASNKSDANAVLRTTWDIKSLIGLDADKGLVVVAKRYQGEAEIREIRVGVQTNVLSRADELNGKQLSGLVSIQFLNRYRALLSELNNGVNNFSPANSTLILSWMNSSGEIDLPTFSTWSEGRWSTEFSIVENKLSLGKFDTVPIAALSPDSRYLKLSASQSVPCGQTSPCQTKRYNPSDLPAITTPK